jgi:hypothetical protein
MVGGTPPSGDQFIGLYAESPKYNPSAFEFSELKAVRPENTDVTYRPSSKLGLMPPDGMSVSEDFVGFQNAERTGMILIQRYDHDAFQNLKNLPFNHRFGLEKPLRWRSKQSSCGAFSQVRLVSEAHRVTQWTYRSLESLSTPEAP